MKAKLFLISIIFLIVSTGYGQTVEYNLKMKRFEESQNVLYYKDSPFDGTLIKRYEDGSLSSKGSYKDGKAEGEWEFYDEVRKGRMKSKGPYKDGKKNGLWETYDKYGELSSTGSYKDGKVDGVWRFYVESFGDLKSRELYKDGERKEYESYHSNGKLESKGSIKNGKRNGHWEFYYSSGKVKSKGYYKDGKLARRSDAIVYYENGKQLSKGFNTNKDGKSVRDRGALLYYETNFAKPSKELLLLLETELSKNINQQNEHKKVINQGKDLTLTEKGEFENQEDYKKREVKHKETLKKINETVTSLESLVDDESFLKNEIASLKTYITKLKPPTVNNEKFTSISKYDSEEESFILEFNGKSYWLYMPIAFAPEFKSNFLDIEILKFPDSFPKFIYNGYPFSLYTTGEYKIEYFPSDGLFYEWVRIGTQIWMAENMSKDAGAGSWAYNNDEPNINVFGRLYNSETAKKICPIGWHLPSTNEWTILANYLGGRDVAGGKMKEVGTWWESPNTGATNSSDFTALPGGYYWNDTYNSSNNKFGDIGLYGYWWLANNYRLELGYKSSKSEYKRQKVSYGFSVRCIKD